MEREQLKELHYITHVDNAQSICNRGLLSHRRAKRFRHESVADPQVQDRRRGKRVGGRLLHDFVNLYMTARNPMLYKLAIADGLADELCVIRVSDDVIELPEVVVTDMNAASPYCRFYGPDELAHVDAGRVFRHYWTDGDAVEQYHCKKAKCAEVLVPEAVSPEYLTGIYVGTGAAEKRLKSIQELEIKRKASFFFNP
jgi:ssDNA thymidine ADP-ribosyltransferase DarT-like protein